MRPDPKSMPVVVILAGVAAVVAVLVSWLIGAGLQGMALTYFVTGFTILATSLFGIRIAAPSIPDPKEIAHDSAH